MPKLSITDGLIQNTIIEMAPFVSRATGWDLQLTTLGSRLLPKDLGYEEILLGRLVHTGIHGWEDMMPDFLERMTEYLIEENVLAAYLPGKGEIVVIRENVDDSNLDGLKLILAHELVHRGQHMVHGRLFTRVDDLLRQVFNEPKPDTMDIIKLRSIIEQIQPIMTLLESHATYIQGLLKQTDFPDARVETHFNIASILLRLVGMPKIAQYTDGLPQVASAATSGNIESLYAGYGG
jgi:hypothetical protein